jgi:hypothetical protein
VKQQKFRTSAKAEESKKEKQTMRVKTSQVLIAGSESASVDLFKKESMPMHVGARRNGFGSQSDNASDADCVSVTNLSGPAAHVQLCCDAATVPPGKTKFLRIFGNSAPVLTYRSEGVLTVLAVATGNELSRQDEMALVAQAMMHVRG